MFKKHNQNYFACGVFSLNKIFQFSWNCRHSDHLKFNFTVCVGIFRDLLVHSDSRHTWFSYWQNVNSSRNPQFHLPPLHVLPLSSAFYFAPRLLRKFDEICLWAKFCWHFVIPLFGTYNWALKANSWVIDQNYYLYEIRWGKNCPSKLLLSTNMIFFSRYSKLPWCLISMLEESRKVLQSRL